MALLCQPAEFEGTIALPTELAVWGIDSGIRHAVTGADYGAVRVGAFMGYRILADLAGFEVAPGDREGRSRIDDPRWGGYLANVGSGDVPGPRAQVPGTLTGGDVPLALRRHHRPGDASRSRSHLRGLEAHRAPDLRARTRHRVGAAVFDRSLSDGVSADQADRASSSAS